MSKELILSEKKYNKLIKQLVKKISFQKDYITDIIAIARGGFYPAQKIAYALNIPKIFSFGVSYYETVGQNKRKIPVVYQTIQENFINKTILLVDDIFDSGKTINYIKEHLKNECGNPETLTATLISKHDFLQPDFYSQKVNSNKWVIFPYERKK